MYKVHVHYTCIPCNVFVNTWNGFCCVVIIGKYVWTEFKKNIYILIKMSNIAFEQQQQQQKQ